MKKILILIIVTGITLFFACEPDQPSAPQLNLTLNQLALSKIVMVGNSLTAGFQSAGMMEDFQDNSYPYLLFQQVGLLTGHTEFEQPIVGAPGIGTPAGMTPMYLDSEGNITQDNLTAPPLLSNLTLERPYDNLGVPGADLNDLLNTTLSDANPWFEIILRNPNFGNTTQLQQVAMLNPTMVLLWAGSNDVLGAALSGGDLSMITSPTDFQLSMQEILTQLRNDIGNRPIIMANIPYVTDIPYVNILDPVFVGIEAFVFNDSLQIIDFGGGRYLPLVTEEDQYVHITLEGLLQYQAGVGIPDSAHMVDELAIPPAQASALEAAMRAGGLNPTGTPLPGNVTISVSEDASMAEAVDAYNDIITTLANTFVVPVIDANALLTQLNTSGIGNATGTFVLFDPANTAFSLDGVHPNNAGNAIIANAFIQAMNAILQLSTPIPTIDADSKLGQYLPTPGKMGVSKAIQNAKDIFIRE